MRNLVLASTLLAALPALGGQGHPDCTGGERWPAVMAFVHLKNAGILENSDVDLGRTMVNRLASEEVSPGLFQQVHDVTYFRIDGSSLRVIAENRVSHEECSMSGVRVYVVSEVLGGER